jgi:hypothetical protein
MRLNVRAQLDELIRIALNRPVTLVGHLGMVYARYRLTLRVESRYRVLHSWDENINILGGIIHSL